MVEVQKLEVFFFFFFFLRFCGDRRGRGTKTRGFLRFLICPGDPLWGSAWFKKSRFLAISDLPGRPSAGIGVVEVQKFEGTRVFAILAVPARPSASAWSRCKNSFFFAVLRCADEPSAGIVRRALAVAPCEFDLVLASPLRRLCVSKPPRCGAV